MAGKRKVEVEIVSTAKGGGFKESEREASRWSKHLGAEGDKVSKSLGDSGEKGGKGFSEKFRSSLSGSASGIMSSFAGFMTAAAKPTAMSIATGFSATFLAQVASGLAAGAAKVAHGFAAGLALLPAAAVTAAVGMATFKIALSGVGDAMSAALTGDAKEFGEAIKGLAPPAQDFARGVRSLKGDITDLKQHVQGEFFAPFAKSVRPLGEKYLPLMRDTLGGVAKSFGLAGKQFAGWAQQPSTVMRIGGALGNMRVSLGDVAGGVADLARAFLPLITVGSTFLPGLTGGFGGATEAAARFMEQAEKTGKLKDWISDGLSKIGDLVNTGKQLGRIFGNIADIGRQAFEHLDAPAGGLLDKIEKLTDKAKAFFNTAKGGEVMAQIMAALKGFAESALGTLQKLALMIAPFLPQIVAFATAFNTLKTAILDAIEPAVQVIGGMLLPALTSVMDWLANNGPVLQGILISLFTLWAINAGIAAVATIAATWPLILLGVAIAALAALVIIHFDTIKRWISNAFHWVRDNWPLLLMILTGPFGAAVAFIKIHWESIVDFVKKLPGRIASAASGMWDGIKGGLGEIVAWVWRQIRSLVQAYNSIPMVPDVGVPGGGRVVTAGSGGGSSRGLGGGGGGGGGGSLRMATGGIIKARPGGTSVIAAEAGVDEAFVPLDGRHRLGTTINLTVNVAGNVYGVDDLYGTISTGLENGRINVRGRRL